MSNNGSSPLVLWYNQLGMNDVDRVGAKNASLGEMITNLSGMGVSVPNGFATTADAFNQFLDQSGVNQRIYALLDETDIDDVSALAKAGAQSDSGSSIPPSRANWKTRFAMLMTCCPPMTPRPHSPCALPPPQKICRTPPSPDSKRHSSTCRALTPCSLP